jgi:archaellum component FlaC
MEEVRKVIEEIDQKIAKMRDSMGVVKSQNETLKSEIDLLAEKLKLREEEAKEFKVKYDDLSQKSDHSGSSNVTDEDQNAQIDALVREIDDCIGRLKE